MARLESVGGTLKLARMILVYLLRDCYISGQPLIEYLKQCDALTPNVNNWVVYVENAMVKPQIDLIAYSGKVSSA